MVSKRAKRLRKKKEGKAEEVKKTGVELGLSFLTDLYKDVNINKPFPFFVVNTEDDDSKELKFKADLKLAIKYNFPIHHFPCFPMPMHFFSVISEFEKEKGGIDTMTEIQNSCLQFMQVNPMFLPYFVFPYNMAMLLSADQIDTEIDNITEKMNNISLEMDKCENDEEKLKLLNTYQSLDSDKTDRINKINIRKGKSWNLMTSTYELLYFYHQVKGLTETVIKRQKEEHYKTYLNKCEEMFRKDIGKAEVVYKKTMSSVIKDAEVDIRLYGKVQTRNCDKNVTLRLIRCGMIYTNIILEAYEKFILLVSGVNEKLVKFIVGYKSPPIRHDKGFYKIINSIISMEYSRRKMYPTVWCANWPCVYSQLEEVKKQYIFEGCNDKDIKIPHQVPTDEELLSMFPHFTPEYTAYTIEGLVRSGESEFGFKDRMQEAMCIFNYSVSEFK